MSKDYNEEKRSVHRHLSELPVWIFIENDKQYVSTIKDMSLFGCCIDQIDRQLQNEAELYLYLEDPKEIKYKSKISPRVIIATLAYQDRQSVGLSFTSVGTEVLSILQAHLEKAKYF
ncbi:MAG: hypothetical protein HQL46_07980 [Gammaproteobacteria bacterium]|nr:hypothetical protein [Gammaproteobacteria bacterium]